MDDLTRLTCSGRNPHSMAFQIPTAGTDIYKGSYFIQIIGDWNALPESVVSFAKIEDDCVAE